MYPSILQFCKKGIIDLDDICAKFFENPMDIAGFVNGVKDEYLRSACEYISDAFEEMDERIRNSALRAKDWTIVRRDRKPMLTSIGEISYRKTLYINKKTGERTYLLDRILGLEENARMTEDAEAQMLEETVQTSYRKGGESASILGQISKGTVKNHLHVLQFPRFETEEEKKQVRYLYIDADEDHVPLQFFEKKGDIRRDGNGRKNNSVQVKLVYVYEGIEPESPGSRRYRLIHPHYFSGVYEGSDNEKLWAEVAEYIEDRYDTEHIEKIYLNADGGNWIKGCKRKIDGITEVLDEYHINKYLTKMTSHLYDSADEGKLVLRDSIREDTKAGFRKVVQKIRGYAKEEDLDRIEEGERYITGNWMAAKIRMRKANGIVGSSTEGHVSHVLADRMSSRPLGWCKTGADRMGKLRAYYWNGGDMLELVRYQKEVRAKARKEKPVYPGEILRSCDRKHAYNGKYFDDLQHSIPAQVRKTLAIRDHLMTS
jgi:hypothetical protein